MNKIQRAFTLIELLVVIALLSILITLAAPSFRDFHRNSQLSSHVNTFIAALQTARNEAIKNNASSRVIPNDKSSWNSGWTVFVDTDFNNSFSQGVDIKVLESDSYPENFKIIANGTADGTSPYISFNGSGYPVSESGSSALTFSIQIDGLSGAEKLKNTRNIKISKTGRIRSCRPSSENDTNCTSPVSSKSG